MARIYGASVLQDSGVVSIEVCPKIDHATAGVHEHHRYEWTMATLPDDVALLAKVQESEARWPQPIPQTPAAALPTYVANLLNRIV